ncbi:MAG: ATP-binding protein [Spirochaetaceae bacterium]|nr:MAG: ATP-binding protein [Spirochaetaceae bacterium]
MIARAAEALLLEYADGFPVVAVFGPRQSGKTTLTRALFPDRPYLSLENLDTREFAMSDPRGFLAQYRNGAIFDEIQNVPTLLSYLQQVVDESSTLGRFIITGSQQYNIRQDISQSLAGRVGAVTLLPFSSAELKSADRLPDTLNELLYQGHYPPIHDRPVSPTAWHENYVASYIERDVRQLVAVRDLSVFQTFLRLCAGRTGQVLNLSALGDDAGVSHNTARAWLSVLEAGFVVHLLQPYHRSFNKRLIKSPKLYFHDVGLAAYLLSIRNADDLVAHPLRGALFESAMVSEFVKALHNSRDSGSLAYWRERRGDEVDLIIERGGTATAVEMKSGSTVTRDMLRGIRRWSDVAGKTASIPVLVYGGDTSQNRTDVTIRPWHSPVPGHA